MKNLVFIVYFFLLLQNCVLFAQEQIHSLLAKQYEIERNIKEALDPYIEPDNYVVKVNLEGKKIREKSGTCGF